MKHVSAHIIDDDPLMADLLGSFLLKFGFRNIIKSYSFTQAQKAHADSVCDIAFIDIKLGDGNGLVLLDSIKQRYPLCKVIVFSGHSTKKNVQTSVKEGADGFLLKPFSMDGLEQTLKRIGYQV